MPGTGNQKGGGTSYRINYTGEKYPTMTPQEIERNRKQKAAKRKANRAAHQENRRLREVASGIAKQVPAFANATKVLANIEDIHEHLSAYMNAGMAILGENFPELVQQTVDSAFEGNEQDRRFLIQKMVDLKPLVEGGSFKNQAMMEKMKSLLEDEGTKVVATERKIEVIRD